MKNISYKSLIDFDFDHKEEYLVIGDSSFFSFFDEIKKEDPLLNIKFMSKEEVVSSLEFNINDNLLSFLISKDESLNYLKSKRLAKDLLFIDENDSDNKYSLLKKEALDKGLIKKDNSFLSLLNVKTVLLFEDPLSNDKGLISLLNRNNISFKYISINNDKKIDEIKDLVDKKVVRIFKNKNEEYHYIFSSINNLIINENVDPSKIYLFVKEIDEFYLSTFSSLYKIPLRYKKERSLISFKEVNDLVSFIFNNKRNISISLIDEFLASLDLNQINNKDVFDNFIKNIKELINMYNLESYSFTRSFLIFEEILSSLSIKEDNTNLIGINVITKPLYKKDGYFFVTNFEYDTFYKYYKNDDVIDDFNLERLNLTTSYNKSEIDKINKLDFILFNNFYNISRIKIHGKDKIYDSQFVDLYKKDYGLIYNDASINKNGLYSEESYNLLSARIKDDKNAKNDENYKSFDNEFKKFHLKKDDLQFSFSKISDYRGCPFQYFINNFVKVDEVEETYYMRLGNFLHEIAENRIKNEDFNLDEEMKKIDDPRFKFTQKEKVLVKYAVKKYFKETIEAIGNFVSDKKPFIDQNDEGIMIEKNITLPLEIDGKNYEVRGKFDAALITKYEINEENTEKNIFLFDFKSGKTKIQKEHIKDGFSLQVPLYTNAIINLYGKDAFREINCAIWPILVEYDGEKNYQDKLKYVGLEPNEVEKYSEYAIDAAKEIIKDVASGDFSIKPTKLKGNNKYPCEFCNYRDICYLKNSQKREIGDEAEGEE